jgi:hypothetical protein
LPSVDICMMLSCSSVISDGYLELVKSHGAAAKVSRCEDRTVVGMRVSNHGTRKPRKATIQADNKDPKSSVTLSNEALQMIQLVKRQHMRGLRICSLMANRYFPGA